MTGVDKSYKKRIVRPAERAFLKWQKETKGTQAEICETIGIQRSNLSSFLKGRSRISEEKLRALADLFGATYEPGIFFFE